jgi:CheY-like chemotaxis protein
LIVEDEIVEAMFLGKLLELWGHESCDTATSGEEALKEAENRKPDLVLMDIHVHGTISGIDAAIRIRSQLGIPVIFLTGYSDEETRQKASAAHPAGYFVKPIDYSTLREAIASILHC